MGKKIGLIGCGNISDTYLINGPLFRDIEYVACADLNPEVARAQAAKYGIEGGTVAALLDRDDIDIILNLTIPAAHAEVSLRALAAGKHVYSEKPLAISLEEGRSILRAAAAANLRVGSAPDTILGAGMQAARASVDSGELGDIVTGLATVLSHGMEDWHSNPGFFFKKGAGPVLDVGPYYIAGLVNLLGSVRRVQATGRIGTPQRLVTAKGAMEGQNIAVETFTTVNALLTFESGAEITFLASWDVWNNDLRPMELHGTRGTLRIPDPNRFGGDVSLSSGPGAFISQDVSSRPFGADNRLWEGTFAYSCYRGLGLADMASGIEAGTQHRCSAELSYHTLEVMLAIEEAALEQRAVTIASRCDRPASLTVSDATRLLAGDSSAAHIV